MVTLQEPATAPKGKRAARAVGRNLQAIIAFAFLGIVVGAALLLATTDIFDPFTADASLRNMPPGTESNGQIYVLGTDPLGRDILSRLVLGSQISLTVGMLSVIVSGAIGVVLGVLAGYFKGWVDDIVMRLVDLQQSVPSLLIALLVLYVAGPSVVNVVLVLAITRWMVYARLARSLVLTLRTELFIEASRSLGASHLRILAFRILPNIAGPLLVLATLELGVMLLTEASLSFLGLGIQPPDSSWGLMLAEGREYISSAWWLVTLPGLAILLTVLSTNLIADWARSRVEDSEQAAIAAVERSMFRGVRRRAAK